MLEKLSHLWAACCLFTRLPLWRIWSVPSECYPYAVHHWMVAGGLISACWGGLVFFGVYSWFPVSITILLLMLGNLFISGAFHEDGLADFFDGFGGGTTKERILEIMKDSHIGTFGVLGLTGYFIGTYVSMLEWSSDFHGLYHAPLACFEVYVAIAVWCRFLSSFLPATLSYARNAETAKVKMIYAPWKKSTYVYMFAVAIGSFALFCTLFPYRLEWMLLLFLTPVVIFALLYCYIKGKIQGYTGDCCGAVVLLCELSMNVVMAVLAYNHITL